MKHSFYCKHENNHWLKRFFVVTETFFILRHIYWKIHMKGSKTKIKQESTNKFQKITHLDPFFWLCVEITLFLYAYTPKNPAYRRHWISQPMRIEAPISIFFFKFFGRKKKIGGGPNYFFWFFFCGWKKSNGQQQQKRGVQKKWPGTDHVTWGPIRGLEKKLHQMVQRSSSPQTWKMSPSTPFRIV